METCEAKALYPPGHHAVTEVMYMERMMDDLIECIRRHSIRRMGQLAAELAEAPSEDKEAVLAELDFERWRADCCER